MIKRLSLLNEHLPFLLSLAAMAVWAAAKYVQFHDWNLEDGYIAYRMARNLSEGNGWVFNLGQDFNPSTSVLNTVLLAGAGLLGFGIPEAAHIEGTLWIFGAGLSLCLLFRPRMGLFLSALAALISMEFLARNGTWGLEINLFIFLALLFLLLELRGRNSWPILGLLILTRPDAVLLAGMKWIFDLARHRTISARGVIQVLLMLMPWAIFSLFTFHQLFPSSFENKMWQGSSGYWGSGNIYLIGLLNNLFDSGAGFLSMLAAGVLGIVVMAVQGSRHIYLPLFAIAQQAGYLRFNVPPYAWYFSFLNFILLYAALFLAGEVVSGARSVFARGDGGRRRWEKPTLIATTVFAAAHGITLTPHSDAGNRHYEAASAAINALPLPQGALAAVETGALGWGVRREIVDLTGLTSPNPEFITGAHNDLFFANPPLVVLLHNPPWVLERGIYDDVRFRLLYGAGTSIAVPYTPLQYFVRHRSAEEATRVALQDFLRGAFTPFGAGAEIAGIESADGTCGSSIINGRRAVSDGMVVFQDLLTFEGWAVAEEDRIDAPVLLLVSPDRQAYQLPVQKQPPPAIVRAPFGEMLVGFAGEGHVLDLPEERYALHLSWWSGSALHLCDTRRKIDIKHLR